jgi:uroporphyrinogen decarboxylase
MRQIVDRVRMAHPDVPMIVFPKGVGAGYLDYVRPAFAAGLSIDAGVPLDWAKCQLQGGPTLQGNLDPQLLACGGAAMRERALAILRVLGGGPFIFNLGHGIVPETPIDNVAELSAMLRDWRAAP